MAKYKLVIKMDFSCKKMKPSFLAKMIAQEWCLDEVGKSELWDEKADVEYKVKYSKGKVKVTNA